MAYLRFQGLRTVIYQDEILILAENRDTLIQQVHYTVQLLDYLGSPPGTNTPHCVPGTLDRLRGHDALLTRGEA